MASDARKYLKFGGAVALILVSMGYLAYTGVQESKSYYVTIKELRGMGDSAYTKHLRVAGNVQPGSIKRTGTRVEFVLVENDQLLPVVYNGTEAPPDTFKDNSQALADGSFGRDGVFHAKQLQAKCASKYAPQQPGQTAKPRPPCRTQVRQNTENREPSTDNRFNCMNRPVGDRSILSISRPIPRKSAVTGSVFAARLAHLRLSASRSFAPPGR